MTAARLRDDDVRGDDVPSPSLAKSRLWFETAEFRVCAAFELAPRARLRGRTRARRPAADTYTPAGTPQTHGERRGLPALCRA